MIRRWPRAAAAASLAALALVGAYAVLPAPGAAAGVATASAAPPAAATPTPAGCSGASDRSDGVGELSPSRHPLALVHGWTAAAAGLGDLADALRRTSGDVVDVRRFDYSGANTDWAAHETVAPCLAAYVRTLSQAHRRAGGDGKVFVMAHSMGGLAALFATDASVTAGPLTSAELGGVVTVATPYLGSPFGGGWGAELMELFAEWRTLPRPYSDAARCLATWSASTALPSGCATPRHLPLDVPLALVDGSAVLRRTLFGFTLYDIYLQGDGVVASTSANGYLSRAYPLGGRQLVTSTTDQCTVTSDETMTLLRSAPGGVPGAIIAAEVRAIALVTADSIAMDGLAPDRASNPLAQAMLLTAAALYDCGHSNVFGAHLAPTVDGLLRQQLAALPGGGSAAGPSATPSGGPAGPWPTSRRDGPPALYVWLGANFMDYPDWVGCDAAGSWCLLGGTARHTLVKMKGLSVVGSVDPKTPDPYAALVALGVSGTAAREILGR